jgi:hypothetical protein
MITSSRNVTYTVGETYNGLVLDNIQNKSIEFPDAMYIEYVGYSSDGCGVFGAVGPVALYVQYEAVED